MQRQRQKDVKEMARIVAALSAHACWLRHAAFSSVRLQARHLLSQIDETYFDSYSYFGIHRDMLGDKARKAISDVVVPG